MFGLFKKKKTSFTKYFPDQNPGERINNVVLKYMRLNLEQHGFKMLKSELTFKKRLKHFEQSIQFTKSIHNRGDKSVRFSIGCIVESKFYSNWHKKIYGVKPINNIILASGCGYLPNWDKTYLHSISWYNLAMDDNSKIVEAVNHNITHNGIQFLDNASNFNSAVDYIMTLERYAATPMLMDFCEIENNKLKAIEVLNWFKKFKNLSTSDVSQETLKEVDMRKERIETGYISNP